MRGHQHRAGLAGAIWRPHAATVLACAFAAAWAGAQVPVPGVTGATRAGVPPVLGSGAEGASGSTPQPTSGVLALSGALEAVTHDAVTVRGGDGILYEALLPSAVPLRSQALVASYRIGDEVAFEAVFIPPRFVVADGHVYQLRLRRLKLKTHGDGGGLRAALRSPAWRAPGNLLPLPAGVPAAAATAPPPPSGDPLLEAARQAVLRYLTELPNFLVTESVTRTSRDPLSEVTDRIESELAVVAGREQRSDIRFNGGRWRLSFVELPGLHWTSDYADQLRPIFQPACGAVFQPAGRGQRDGQAVAVYNFHLPPSVCAGRVQAGPAWVYPQFEGKVYISTTSHLVLRLEERDTHLPGGFEVSSSQDATDWAPATVGGVRWLLPARAQLTVRSHAGRLVTVAVSYGNYRRFESSTSFTVVGSGSAPAAK